MSIWTDLLFLHGHVSTPTGLAQLAPRAFGPPTTPAQAPDEPTITPSLKPARAPSSSATAAVAELATRPISRPRPPELTRATPLPRPNRISPNDLW